MFDGKRVTAILLAAGSGTRFGAAQNKVYVPVCGKPILQYSLDVLGACPEVDEGILVVKAGEEERARALSVTGKWVPRLVTGGATRQESVYRGLHAASGEIVLIHDGARPLLRRRDVIGCLAAMRDFPGAAAAVRSKDTIKISDEAGVVTETTPRERTWVVQTPQCFHRDELLAAHEKYRTEEGITDDCMLLERAGARVKLVEADYTNIKVTTAEDRRLAETFLRARGAADGIGQKERRTDPAAAPNYGMSRADKGSRA